MPNTPYFALSRSGLVDQYKAMLDIADTVWYSSKTNYDAVPVLERRTDTGFTVHSKKALRHIDDPRRAAYYPEGDTEAGLDDVYDKGVSTYVIDNQADLATLTDWAPTTDGVDVFVRMKRREHSVETGKHYVFGMDSDTVHDAVVTLDDVDNVEHIGVHVHRKTQNVAEWRLKDELSSTLSPDVITRIDAVNAGGGFPVQYENYKRDAMPAIRRRFADLRSWCHQHGLELIIEPGRIIAAPPGRLHTTIINAYDDTVVIDASVYNAAMDTFVNNTRLSIAEETTNGEPYTVKGCTPDSIDILRYKASLDSPEPGDTLTFENATAYNYASDFCDLTPPETVLTE